jgi:histidyl-tRNA synthetase
MCANQQFAVPRGMRDFYPEDMAVRNRIFQAWTAAAERHGFTHYDSCVVESLELLKRKGGEEIVEQIYFFKDKSDRDLALRPEMTPTLARMVAARQGLLGFPLKWFAIAQCFRYERTTRGRKREHYQWNLDIVGERSTSAETEVLAAAVDALMTLGLAKSDFRIRVNNRVLLGELFASIGVPAVHHAALFLALDKRGKVEDVTPLLREAGLDDAAVTRVLQVIDIRTLDDAARIVGDASPGVAALRDLFRRLDLYGIGDVVEFDISVIRGLGYYTGIVFEAFDTAGAMRAIFGGGRYDNLLTDVGGRPDTAVGLGFGDVVLAELLEEKGKLQDVSMGRELAVGFMEDAQLGAAMGLARSLRSEGRRVDLALRAEKARQFFSRVDRDRFREAVYLGPDDVARGSARVKNLVTRDERVVTL